jgi:hypothetical protein
MFPGLGTLLKRAVTEGTCPFGQQADIFLCKCIFSDGSQSSSAGTQSSTIPTTSIQTFTSLNSGTSSVAPPTTTVVTAGAE